jgi:hypothetical protein
MALRRMVWMAMLMVASLATPVLAQDDPRIGITMGFPAAVGVVWRVADNIALRPDITFQRSSSESATTIALPTFPVTGVSASSSTNIITTESWSVGVGVSAVFYISKHDALRTYLSPRWGYTRSSADGSSSIPSVISVLSNTHSQTVGGAFGAQYALSRKFNIYGEVGLSYSHTTLPGSDILNVISRTDTTQSSIGTRGGVGVILFF